MPISASQSIGIILVAALCTFLTRAFPFLLFGGKREVPPMVQFLGKTLPPSVMAILIIYCLRDSLFTNFSALWPQLLGIAVVVVLHLWKRNNLLSIGGGTLFYMVLVQIFLK